MPVLEDPATTPAGKSYNTAVRAIGASAPSLNCLRQFAHGGNTLDEMGNVKSDHCRITPDSGRCSAYSPLSHQLAAENSG